MSGEIFLFPLRCFKRVQRSKFALLGTVHQVAVFDSKSWKSVAPPAEYGKPEL
jgi:hypothetical protein